MSTSANPKRYSQSILFSLKVFRKKKKITNDEKLFFFCILVSILVGAVEEDTELKKDGY
jgi:hypothetical protein